MTGPRDERRIGAGGRLKAAAQGGASAQGRAEGGAGGSAVAVVTGASAGIGAALAEVLAARGHDLLLVARRTDRLREIADRLHERHGVKVEPHGCDLADRAERSRLAKDLADRDVSVLCANAGFATCGPLRTNAPDRERAEIEVNAVALHDLTLAVLPGMLARRTGALLLTGSTAGFQPIPTAATYSATKAFVNTFAEALHVELRGTGVTCTLLAPGPVRTEFAAVADVPHIESHRWFAWGDPHRVAEQAIVAMERGRRVVVPGTLAKAQWMGGRHTPRSVLFPVLRGAILPFLRRPASRPSTEMGRRPGRPFDR